MKNKTDENIVSKDVALPDPTVPIYTHLTPRLKFEYRRSESHDWLRENLQDGLGPVKAAKRHDPSVAD